MAVCTLRQRIFCGSRFLIPSTFSCPVIASRPVLLKMTSRLNRLYKPSYAQSHPNTLFNKQYKHPFRNQFRYYTSVTSSVSHSNCTKFLQRDAAEPSSLTYIDSILSNAVSRSTHTSTACCSVQYATKPDVARKLIPQDSNQPSLEQLENVQKFMAEQIPDILSKRHEYRIYTKDLIFVNNWNPAKPYTTIGISRYVMKVIKARWYVHTRYAMVSVSVVNGRVDEASGCVSVQWRVAGLQQSKAFMFWNYRPFQFRATGKQQSGVMDGISTFHVNNKGFITKHVLDRVALEDKTKEPNDSGTDKSTPHLST